MSKKASGADNQQVTNLMQARKITPDYLCGLVDGEGCFYILATKKFTCEFKISQKDKRLLEQVRLFLKCGHVKSNYDKHKTWVYIVKDIKSLSEKIIPFFRKNGLIIKKEQFVKFSEVVKLINAKEHLTVKGKEKIKRIKLGTSETTR